MSQLSGKMHWPTAAIEEKKEKEIDREGESGEGI